MNYSTEISCSLFLNEAPSDFEDSSYLFEIINNDYDDYRQRNVYVKDWFVTEIIFCHIKGSDETTRKSEWGVTATLPDKLSDSQVITFLNDLCNQISYQCMMKATCQHSGFVGFSYSPVSIQIFYVDENNHKGPNTYYGCGISLAMKQTLSIEDCFALPSEKKTLSPTTLKMQDAFLAAMRSRDPVARYILLYYLFEIIYTTSSYKKCKQYYLEGKKEKSKDADRNRGAILFSYLYDNLGIQEYHFYGEQHILKADILVQIIKSRNDLVHRADQSMIEQLMYEHMIPIIKEVLKKMKI